MGSVAAPPRTKQPTSHTRLCTIPIKVRIGGVHLGWQHRRIREGATLKDLIADSNLPEGLDLVVVNRKFKTPVPLAAELELKAGMQLFFTRMTHIGVKLPDGQTVRWDAPVFGLTLSSLPHAMEVKTGNTMVRDRVLVNGKPTSTSYQQQHMVEDGQEYTTDDP